MARAGDTPIQFERDEDTEKITKAWFTSLWGTLHEVEVGSTVVVEPEAGSGPQYIALVLELVAEPAIDGDGEDVRARVMWFYRHTDTDAVRATPQGMLATKTTSPYSNKETGMYKEVFFSNHVDPNPTPLETFISTCKVWYLEGEDTSALRYEDDGVEGGPSTSGAAAAAGGSSSATGAGKGKGAGSAKGAGGKGKGGGGGPGQTQDGSVLLPGFVCRRFWDIQKLKWSWNKDALRHSTTKAHNLREWLQSCLRATQLALPLEKEMMRRRRAARERLIEQTGEEGLLAAMKTKYYGPDANGASAQQQGGQQARQTAAHQRQEHHEDDEEDLLMDVDLHLD